MERSANPTFFTLDLLQKKLKNLKNSLGVEGVSPSKIEMLFLSTLKVPNPKQHSKCR